jgi:nitrite reductase/ring-hydroxylating ferredoxin subunit
MTTSKVQYFLIAILFLLTNGSCRKKEDVVPYTKVNFTIFLSDPDFVTLQTVGNHVFVTGGVCGISIYRVSQEQFSAIERCCSYKPSDRCPVVIDSTNNTFLKCNCCNSTFSIIDGSVLSGVASRPLTMYTTQFDATNNSLHVYN